MASHEEEKTLKPVTHCIFDLDGTLLDTETIYEEVVRRIAAEYDKPYPLEVRMKLLGTTEQRSAQIAITDLELPLTIDEYLNKFHTICKEMLVNAKLMKGAQQLICHLNANKIPFALATSSSDRMVKLKTKKYRDLFKLFHHQVCGSTDPEVKEGKPAPDIFLIAARRFPDNPDPAKCLVFEDAPNGVRAGISAGMQTIMIPDPRTSADHRLLATKVLNSLEDFVPEQFGLPPYRCFQK